MDTISMIPGYYTVREAAAVLKRDRSAIARYIRAGLLPAVDLGAFYLLEQDPVHKFRPPPPGNPKFRKILPAQSQ